MIFAFDFTAGLVSMAIMCDELSHCC